MPLIDPNDPRSPYQQIADDLRQRIESGDPASGTRMASNRELAAEYGVAAMTVHQAIRLLRDEGLVESWQGRGVFVRDPAAPPARYQNPAMNNLAADVSSLTEALEALTERTDRRDDKLAADITDLRTQLARFQAQLIDLYARTGQAYPQDAPEMRSRRKASGS